jgi:hypothetical protein
MRLGAPSASWREVSIAVSVWRGLHVLGDKLARQRATLDLKAFLSFLLSGTL